jgi:FtsH-binding integral membrane protein
MSFDPQHSQQHAYATTTASRDEIDAGLRSYMLRVYNYMALGVAFTGVVALFVAGNQAIMQAVALGPFKWVLFVGILGLGWFAPRVILTGSSVTGQIAFWVYAAMWGALMAPMFHVYTEASIARVFFITAGMFAGISLYGYTTKRDLAPMGRFLSMATIGILIALLVNMFLVKSSGFDMILSIVVVLVFSGLTAYETQAIKESFFADESHDVQSKKAIFGAFILYGSFVTLFIWMLHLFGNRE